MSQPLSFGSIDTKKAPCDGHCYDVPALEPSSDHSSQQEAESGQLLPSDSEPLGTYTYRALKLAQTIILRLHPNGRSPEGEFRDDGLYADLVTVNLHVLEGVLIDGTTENIHYDALSYSWGHVELSETLVVDGRAKSISGQNAIALRALRHPTQIANLWIDALCINQDDKQEKSEQVAQMLAIYKKARSVTAWLGSPDSDSLLAFACARRLPALENDLSEHREREHKPSCVSQLMAIHYALRGLFERPWFGRTWIRQEIYGARHLTVQCGLNSASWDDFMRLVDLMSTIRPLVLHASTISQGQYARNKRIQRLLHEARANAKVPQNGVKQPRDILEVLLTSTEFVYTDPRDVFYAALGMCNVQTSANTSTRSNEDQRKVVQVDYKKTLGEVYTDATLYIMSRRDSLSDLKTLWVNKYQRTRLHSKDLPTWAVDWQSNVHSSTRQALSDKARSSHVYGPTSNDLVFTLAGDDWLSRSSSGVNGARWWHWPEPLPEDRSVLRCRVRVLNYIAHLTDYTCDPSDVTSCKHSSGWFELGSASRLVHADRVARQPGPWFSHIPKYATKFEQQTHLWRIAILGIPGDQQICLMPSSADKGDLVVFMTPELPSIVIHPTKCTSTAAGLYEEHDLNEKLSHDMIGKSRIGHPDRLFPIWHHVLVALGVCTLLLNISASNFAGNTFAMLLTGFREGLTVLLAGHLTCTWIYVHSECFTCHRYSRDGPVFSEGLVTLCTTCSFSVGIWASEGSSRSILIVYFASTLATLIVSDVWRFCSLSINEIPIILRRKMVFELLDSIMEYTGPDYEFHGPLVSVPNSELPTFSKPNRSQKRRRPLVAVGVRGRDLPPKYVLIPSLLMWRMKKKISSLYRLGVSHLTSDFVVAVHNRIKGREYVKDSCRRWLDAQIVNPPPMAEWDRPLQEIKLH